MLGKRQRSMLMRRTTSVASLPSVAKQVRQASGGDRARAGPSSSASAGAVGTGGATSPRNDAGELADVMMTAAFLTVCGFCGKGLGPGKDTYIYRGEVAFCSHECRERQIEQDELMEQNCSLTSIREAAHPSGRLPRRPPAAPTSPGAAPGTRSPPPSQKMCKGCAGRVLAP